LRVVIAFIKSLDTRNGSRGFLVLLTEKDWVVFAVKQKNVRKTKTTKLMITLIKNDSIKQSEHRPLVPLGNYAVEVNGEMTLAKVKENKRGELYVKGASKEESQAILLELEKSDLELAHQHYGQISGRCYNCNRQLSDPNSRHDGIGPVCKRKFNKVAKI